MPKSSFPLSKPLLGTAPTKRQANVVQRRDEERWCVLAGDEDEKSDQDRFRVGPDGAPPAGLGWGVLVLRAGRARMVVDHYVVRLF